MKDGEMADDAMKDEFTTVLLKKNHDENEDD
jgi:hypothetical protein